ncbi:hypothetical protein TB1_046061 [Malus domestica]
MEHQGSSICFHIFLELRIASLRMKKVRQSLGYSVMGSKEMRDYEIGFENLFFLVFGASMFVFQDLLYERKGGRGSQKFQIRENKKVLSSNQYQRRRKIRREEEDDGEKRWGSCKELGDGVRSELHEKQKPIGGGEEEMKKEAYLAAGAPPGYFLNLYFPPSDFCFVCRFDAPRKADSKGVACVHVRKYCQWMRTLTSKLQIRSKKPRSVNIKCISHWQRNKAKQFWFAFVLYSVKSLSDKNSDNSQKSSDDNGFSLFQILRAAKLKYVSQSPFFPLAYNYLLMNSWHLIFFYLLGCKRVAGKFCVLEPVKQVSSFFCEL